MYTTLDLSDLVQAIASAVREAFAFRHLHHLIFTGPTSPCTWPTPHYDGSQPTRFSADDVIYIVQILVTRTYICNGSRIRLQSTGLPMGTNPAPRIADLDCYPKEASAMDRLSTTDVSLARKFRGTFRYIDDILSLDITLDSVIWFCCLATRPRQMRNTLQSTQPSFYSTRLLLPPVPPIWASPFPLVALLSLSEFPLHTTLSLSPRSAIPPSVTVTSRPL